MRECLSSSYSPSQETTKLPSSQSKTVYQKWQYLTDPDRLRNSHYRLPFPCWKNSDSNEYASVESAAKVTPSEIRRRFVRVSKPVGSNTFSGPTLDDINTQVRILCPTDVTLDAFEAPMEACGKIYLGKSHGLHIYFTRLFDFVSNRAISTLLLFLFKKRQTKINFFFKFVSYNQCYYR